MQSLIQSVDLETVAWVDLYNVLKTEMLKFENQTSIFTKIRMVTTPGAVTRSGFIEAGFTGEEFDSWDQDNSGGLDHMELEHILRDIFGGDSKSSLGKAIGGLKAAAFNLQKAFDKLLKLDEDPNNEMSLRLGEDLSKLNHRFSWQLDAFFGDVMEKLEVSKAQLYTMMSPLGTFPYNVVTTEA